LGDLAAQDSPLTNQANLSDGPLGRGLASTCDVFPWTVDCDVADVAASLASSVEALPGEGLPSQAAFSFPIRDVNELRSYLLRPGAPTKLVLFEFSGALRDELNRDGVVAISNDLRKSETPGPHFEGDCRVIACIKVWDDIFCIGPNCYQMLRADEDCLHAKMMDGRAFFGGLMVLLCLHIGEVRRMRIVEQPDTIVYDFIDVEKLPDVRLQEVSSTQWGDSIHKFFRFALVNMLLPDTTHPRRRNSGPRSQFQYADADARDQARSSWAQLPATYKAVARATPVGMRYPP
jgi:hypothetical protein